MSLVSSILEGCGGLIVAGEWSCRSTACRFRTRRTSRVADGLRCGAAVREGGPTGSHPGWYRLRRAQAIAEICALVEGLPLALELAAAWVRLLPCATIAAEAAPEPPSCCRPSDAAHGPPPSSPASTSCSKQSWRRLSAGRKRERAWRGCRCFVAASAPRPQRLVAGASLPALAAPWPTGGRLLRKDGRAPASQSCAGAGNSPHCARATGRPGPRPRGAHAAYFQPLCGTNEKPGQ
jgi:hypothetical protein